MLRKGYEMFIVGPTALLFPNLLSGEIRVKEAEKFVEDHT